MSFRNGKRENMWGGGGGGGGEAEGRCMVNFFVHIKLRIINSNASSEIVNPYLTLYLWKFRVYKSPDHFMWTTILGSLKISL